MIGRRITSHPRRAKLHRKTTETDIRLTLAVDGRGKYEISTGIRFLDHMLELFTRHGGFDLKLSARGDLDVDQHHTVEDVGFALGDDAEFKGRARGLKIGDRVAFDPSLGCGVKMRAADHGATAFRRY